MEQLETIKSQAAAAAEELVAAAGLKSGSLLVIGCSTSEVAGKKIGTLRSPEIAAAIFDGIYPVLKKHGVYLAAQCCEHLNRAIAVEREYASAHGLEEVNVRPIRTAGGSFAAKVFDTLDCAMVEEIAADAGIDIGDTLIGMHLKRVAVPVRLAVKNIGEANVVAARTRPKYIGGERAVYF